MCMTLKDIITTKRLERLVASVHNHLVAFNQVAFTFRSAVSHKTFLTSTKFVAEEFREHFLETEPTVGHMIRAICFLRSASISS